MSQAGQFREYAEESKTPGRRIRSPQKSAPASPKTSEYHLIDLTTGASHGGFESLTGARQHARDEGLPAWDIFHGNVRVEYHDPREVDPVHQGAAPDK
jgi:hypothetical protein